MPVRCVAGPTSPIDATSASGTSTVDRPSPEARSTETVDMVSPVTTPEARSPLRSSTTSSSPTIGARVPERMIVRTPSSVSGTGATHGDTHTVPDSAVAGDPTKRWPSASTSTIWPADPSGASPRPTNSAARMPSSAGGTASAATTVDAPSGPMASIGAAWTAVALDIRGARTRGTAIGSVGAACRAIAGTAASRPPSEAPSATANDAWRCVRPFISGRSEGSGSASAARSGPSTSRAASPTAGPASCRHPPGGA